MKNDQKWYVLKTISGQEKIVKEQLAIELERKGMGHYVNQILLPSEKVYEMRQGKKRMRDRHFFPSYIILHADLSDGRLIHLVKEMPGALGFLGARGWGSKTTPIPLQEKEINRLLGKIKDIGEYGMDLEMPFVIGETIKIIDGPFTGFSGTVDSIQVERKKATIIVKVFERDTPIDLSYAQIEKVR